MQKINILITGGLGHIGSFLVPFFLKKNFVKQIFIVDNLTSERFCSLFNLPKRHKINFVQSDLLKLDLKKKFTNVDVIIHLAALTNAEESVGNAKKYLKNNFFMTKKVVEFANASKKKLIFPSSTSVYGKSSKLVNEQNDKINLCPQSPYAYSKVEEENFINKFRDKNLKFIILRLGTIFGVSKGIRFHTAVNKFCWQAANEQEITVWKTALNQKRPYLGIEDTSRAFEHIIRRNIFDGNTYNLVSQNTTVKKLIQLINKNKIKTKIKFINSKIMNQLSYNVCNKKFVSLGFKFDDKVEEGIKETLRLLR